MFLRRSVVDPPYAAPPTSDSNHLQPHQEWFPPFCFDRQVPRSRQTDPRRDVEVDRNPARRYCSETGEIRLERARPTEESSSARLAIAFLNEIYF